MVGEYAVDAAALNLYLDSRRCGGVVIAIIDIGVAEMSGGERVFSLVALESGLGAGVSEIAQNKLYLAAGSTREADADTISLFVGDAGWVLEGGVTGNLESL